MVIGVIPARFGSSRLLGKPLANIGGKPMLQHTFESASKSKFIKKIVIAVDDERVGDVASKFCNDVVLTPKTIETGSDRIAYVAEKMPEVKIVVNIQGDEPFINGRMIDEAIEPLLFDKNIRVSTLAKRIVSVEELKSNSIPKLVFDYENFVLYFSRAPIPYVQGVKSNLDKLGTANIYKHIGLYVFRRNTLLKFTKLGQTDLEKAEKLEQLRMLENGIKIKVVVTEFDTLSVDTPDDLERARRFYNKLLKIRK
ncbi:MAG: 3-deoxy-manno-octulosonate cytidylyltransferase [Bacteroidetes bacterium]|nr:3-deoxy-manno-octulosonate cytidylyltransferase [Bacteroidota bacterium]MCH8171562.1 3-deoxy-manno-octulosonate cytidylyltransferase [Bacteroidota bacterium]MCH8942558.1 3-deoxy-manno-octulosonate cytidylyltransferase [Bacteroidota bacterium]